MPRQRWEYAPIPSAICRRSDIEPAGKVIIAAIAKLQGPLLWGEMSHGIIAQEAGMSRRTILRLIPGLLATGLVERKNGGHANRWFYSIPAVRERNQLRGRLSLLREKHEEHAIERGKLTRMPAPQPVTLLSQLTCDKDVQKL